MQPSSSVVSPTKPARRGGPRTLLEQIEEASVSALSNLGRRCESEDGDRKEPLRRALAAQPDLLAARPSWFRRMCRTSFFVAPLLERACGRPLSELTVLEIGCGSGARTLALAPLVKRMISCDLNPKIMAGSRRRAAEAGITNVEWVEANAQDIVGSPIARECDVITMYALLEHTLISERLATLEGIRENVPDETVVYIGETPNRLAGFDHHSSQLPFFQSLPDELALKYLARSPRREYADDVVGDADPVERLHRRGRGPSFHEFDLGFGGLDAFSRGVTLASDDVRLLNLYGTDGDSDLLRRRLELRGIPRADLFSRHYLEFAMRRSGPPAPGVVVLTGRDMVGGRVLPDRRANAVCVAGKGEAVRVSLPAGATSVSLGLLLGQLGGERARGVLSVTTPSGASHEFSIRKLACWRPGFALYHNYAYVDIPLGPGDSSGELVLRTGPRAHVALAGAFVRLGGASGGSARVGDGAGATG